MIEYIFQRILLLSLAGTLATAIVLPVSHLTKGIFSSKWRYYSCILALIVFLVPLSVKVSEKDMDRNLQSDKAIILRVENIVKTETPSSDLSELQNIAEHSTDFSSIYKYGFFLWLFGCVGYLSFNVISHILYTTRLRRNSVFQCYNGLLPDQKCKRLRICKTDKVLSPQLIGIIRPVLYLPDTEISDEDLRNILRHELIHCKRFDIVVKWLCVIAKSVHWFNPAVFLLAKTIDIECEISCDISATKRLDKSGVESYCETILSLISAKNSCTSPILYAGSTKRILERRFKAIMEEKSVSKNIAAVSATIAAVIVLAALTASAILGGCAKKEETENNKKSSTPSEKTSIKQETIDGVIKAPEAETHTSSKMDESSAGSESGQDLQQETVIKYVVVDDETEYKLIPDKESVNGAAEISAGYDSENHIGVDYRLEAGTEITSPFDGTVTAAEYSPDKGNHIEIEGLDGDTKVIFAHLDKMYVSSGDKVADGDKLGTVGSTGKSTGPHLHVEYFANGEAQNPVHIFLVEDDGTISAVFSKPELIID